MVLLFLSSVGLALSNFLILQQKEIANKKTVEATQQKTIADEKAADAQRESRYARAIADFVKNDFLALTSVDGQEEFDDYGKFELSRNTTLRELIDRAANKLDLRTDLDPRIEAELRWMIGRNYLGMSEYSRAVAFLEESVEAHREANGDNAEETLSAQHNLAEAYDAAGQIRRSHVAA